MSTRDFEGSEGGRLPEQREQAHGDALAALQRMKLRLPVSDECAYQHAMDAVLVRRHLTASGVPYVPEEIRALPEKLRHRYKIGIPNDLGCAIAYELEKMIDRASAPAVPGRYGEHANDVVADSNWSAGARFGWNCAIVGDKDRLERAIQSRVDERAAAAPQRGGE